MEQERDATRRDAIQDVQELEDALSEPTDGVVDTMGRLEGDVIVLGVGGKMGPTLARMAVRASEAAGTPRRVIGVSRFSSGDLAEKLDSQGVETIRCDLHDEAALDALPEAPNVVFMAGMKFGSTGQEALTWATNTYLPAVVSRKFRRSRIVAFSTGNIYGLTAVESGGSRETDAPDPDGDYAMSCLGRERIFEHFSRKSGTPMALVRLNYAVELRYGVLVDLGAQVLAGEPIDLSMGHFNAIWQGDANAMTLRCFDHVSSPPFVVNVTGLEALSIRHVCEELGHLLGKPPAFTGAESPDALLSCAEKAHRLFGPPRVDLQHVMRLVADWLGRGGDGLGKPTHFQVRDGRF